MIEGLHTEQTHERISFEELSSSKSLSFARASTMSDDAAGGSCAVPGIIQKLPRVDASISYIDRNWSHAERIIIPCNQKLAESLDIFFAKELQDSTLDIASMKNDSSTSSYICIEPFLDLLGAASEDDSVDWSFIYITNDDDTIWGRIAQSYAIYAAFFIGVAFMCILFLVVYVYHQCFHRRVCSGRKSRFDDTEHRTTNSDAKLEKIGKQEIKSEAGAVHVLLTELGMTQCSFVAYLSGFIIIGVFIVLFLTMVTLGDRGDFQRFIEAQKNLVLVFPSGTAEVFESMPEILRVALVTVGGRRSLKATIDSSDESFELWEVSHAFHCMDQLLSIADANMTTRVLGYLEMLDDQFKIHPPISISDFIQHQHSLMASLSPPEKVTTLPEKLMWSGKGSTLALTTSLERIKMLKKVDRASMRSLRRQIRHYLGFEPNTVEYNREIASIQPIQSQHQYSFSYSRDYLENSADFIDWALHNMGRLHEARPTIKLFDDGLKWKEISQSCSQEDLDVEMDNTGSSGKISMHLLLTLLHKIQGIGQHLLSLETMLSGFVTSKQELSTPRQEWSKPREKTSVTWNTTRHSNHDDISFWSDMIEKLQKVSNAVDICLSSNSSASASVCNHSNLNWCVQKAHIAVTKYNSFKERNVQGILSGIPDFESGQPNGTELLLGMLNHPEQTSMSLYNRYTAALAAREAVMNDIQQAHALVQKFVLAFGDNPNMYREVSETAAKLAQTLAEEFPTTVPAENNDESIGGITKGIIQPSSKSKHKVLDASNKEQNENQRLSRQLSTAIFGSLITNSSALLGALEVALQGDNSAQTYSRGALFYLLNIASQLFNIPRGWTNVTMFDKFAAHASENLLMGVQGIMDGRTGDILTFYEDNSICLMDECLVNTIEMLNTKSLRNGYPSFEQIYKGLYALPIILVSFAGLALGCSAMGQRMTVPFITLGCLIAPIMLGVAAVGIPALLVMSDFCTFVEPMLELSVKHIEPMICLQLGMNITQKEDNSLVCSWQLSETGQTLDFDFDQLLRSVLVPCMGSSFANMNITSGDINDSRLLRQEPIAQLWNSLEGAITSLLEDAILPYLGNNQTTLMGIEFDMPADQLLDEVLTATQHAIAEMKDTFDCQAFSSMFKTIKEPLCCDLTDAIFWLVVPWTTFALGILIALAPALLCLDQYRPRPQLRTVGLESFKATSNVCATNKAPPGSFRVDAYPGPSTLSSPIPLEDSSIVLRTVLRSLSSDNNTVHLY